jgi:hypothetical protein
MRRIFFLGLLLALAGTAAQAADLCDGKVIATVLAYDRAARQGVGLLLNQCHRPLAAEVLVMARNVDGFIVARLRTHVQASAAPLSVIRVDLPFVQSAISLSGYAVEVAAAGPRRRGLVRHEVN